MATKAVEYKIENVKKYTILAFDEYNKTNYDNSLNNARKACEAISRAIILKRMNSRDGMKVVLGEIDTDKKPQKRQKHGFEPPLLYKLLFYLDTKNWIDKALYYRFQDIRYGGNNASHDAISVKSETTQEDAQLFLEQFKWILKWFWSKEIKLPIPTNLILNTQNQNQVPLSPQYLAVWNEFYNECNFFSNEQRFILITPSTFGKTTANELNVFTRIKWNLILDFDPNSKTNGLYKAISDGFSTQKVRPITIEEKERKDEIISNSNYALNWFFANGLDSIPATIGKTIREWRTTLKYSIFIRRLIKELVSEKVQNYIFIYLLEDIQYLQTIIPAIDESLANSKLAKHLIVYQNEEFLPRLTEEFQQYDAKFFNLPTSALIAGINRSVNKESIDVKKMLLQIPARGEKDEDTFIDISNDYISYLDRGIEVLHQGISNENNVHLEDGAFYKGNVIAWKELAVDLDATRSILNDLLDYNQKWLDAAKGAYVVELFHKPGSGGTTIARRAAFKFHTKYPTILINKYHREKTNQAIFELAEISHKPVFAVIEAYQVTQNELNALVRKINEDKKHVVILYLSRSFNNYVKTKDHFKTIYLSDKTLDLNERNRFTSKYQHVALPGSKQALKSLGERNPHECEVIDFVITAYQDEYSAQKVEDYVYHYLDRLTLNHTQFVGFAALIYYYTQNSTLDLWFTKLFSKGTINGDYLSVPEDEKLINKLFINEYDQNNENTNYWRPRFSQFASEILKLVLVGLNKKNKGNWKDYLSRWSIDLIKECRSNQEYLTDDIRELFKSLFLNRDNEDVLGIDENYDNSNISDRKFSSIIKHIGDKDQQLTIFKAIVEAYPDEAHFRGHLGRFLYEKALEPKEFEAAFEEITIALEMVDNDYNLWHIRGMCNRRKIEMLVRSNLEAYSVDERLDLEEIVQELTESASDDFIKSRSINPHNLHSHAAQVQTLIQVIDFGRQLSKAKTKTDFLSDTQNEWYENELSEVFNLIDEAKYIIELSRDIDQSKFILKSKRMIESCEAKLFGLIGDYSQSVDKFKHLSENADRSLRPYFRKMFVFATLGSKVNNQYADFKFAWPQLSGFEFDSIKKAIENNIREEPENSNHIKLWLQAVRYSKNYVSLEECFSTVKIWYDNSVKFEIAHLEATYYLYVISACKAISDGDSFNDLSSQDAKRYMKECKEKKVNDKFSFEWYGKNTGIKRLVNHTILGKMTSEKRFFIDKSLDYLDRVTGTITNIQDRQKGKITLRCGLDAFFVPSSGGFKKDTDETTEVTFYIGFRQDGLFAWEVRKIRQDKVRSNKIIDTTTYEIEDYDFLDEVNEDVIKDVNEGDKLSSTLFKTEPQMEENKIEGLKIIGKIDLSQIERNKK